MNNDPDQRPLSSILEPYRDRIAATIKPYLRMTLVADKSLTWWSSKFPGYRNTQAGFPYLPKGMTYPQTPEGEYLHLLCQINFAQMPVLDAFPQQGILQFYIADQVGWGCPEPNYGDLLKATWYQQNTFRILYFPELELDEANLVTHFDFLPEKNPDVLDPYPQDCSAIEWHSGVAPMSCDDYRIYNLIFEGYARTTNEELEAYSIEVEEYCGEIHIGGYATFAQEDPRDFAFEEIEGPLDTVLLKISMPENVLLFYIQESDLRRRDFSHVLYTFS